MRRLAGSHAPNVKNRSSKHLSLIMGHKPYVRSASNAFLQQLAGNGIIEATAELNRRAKKASKNSK